MSLVLCSDTQKNSNEVNKCHLFECNTVIKDCVEIFNCLRREIEEMLSGFAAQCDC